MNRKEARSGDFAYSNLIRTRWGACVDTSSMPKADALGSGGIRNTSGRGTQRVGTLWRLMRWFWPAP